MDLQKLLKIIAAVVSLASIVFLGSLISAGDEAIKAGESSSSVNSYMFLAYLALLIAILSTIAFTIINIITNSSGLVKTMISVGVFLFLSLICYFIASGNETILKDGSVLTVSQSRLVGAGLYLFYFLSFIAAGTMLFFGVKKSLNK